MPVRTGVLLLRMSARHTAGRCRKAWQAGNTPFTLPLCPATQPSALYRADSDDGIHGRRNCHFARNLRPLHRLLAHRRSHRGADGDFRDGRSRHGSNGIHRSCRRCNGHCFFPRAHFLQHAVPRRSHPQPMQPATALAHRHRHRQMHRLPPLRGRVQSPLHQSIRPHRRHEPLRALLRLHRQMRRRCHLLHALPTGRSHSADAAHPQPACPTDGSGSLRCVQPGVRKRNQETKHNATA